MSREIKKVKVNATGLSVEVYRLNGGGWCNFADCKTLYKEDELTFPNQTR